MTAHPLPTHAPTTRFAREIAYAPNLDGAADPGEVVWTWVRYEEDPTQGKDRPVLVVGRETDASGRSHLLGLMLSSKDYHRDDPDWFPLGEGAWDTEHRNSYVRLDRVLLVLEDGIRREGAILDRARFAAVAQQLRTRFGWR
ncbi:type II toxin-antitoxin system PemK/MazF family toxin [Gordonia sp. NPDC003424]